MKGDRRAGESATSAVVLRRSPAPNADAHEQCVAERARERRPLRDSAREHPPIDVVGFHSISAGTWHWPLATGRAHGRENGGRLRPTPT